MVTTAQSITRLPGAEVATLVPTLPRGRRLTGRHVRESSAWLPFRFLG